MIAWIKGIWAVVKASSWMAMAIKIGALVLGALAVVAMALSRAKNAGRNEERGRVNEAALDNVRKGREATNRADSMSEAEARKEAKRWARD